MGGMRGYELPTLDILRGIVFESGPKSRTDFDVIIEFKGDPPKRINKLHRSYMSLQFPLLFVFGEPGFYPELRGDREGITAGSVILLPSTSTGGPRSTGEPSTSTSGNGKKIDEIQNYVCNSECSLGRNVTCYFSRKREKGCKSPIEVRTMKDEILPTYRATFEALDPSKLWAKHWQAMKDDTLMKISKSTGIPNYHVNTSELQGYILYELETILDGFGKCVKDFRLQSPPKHLLKDLENKLLMEEKNYNRELLMQDATDSDATRMSELIDFIYNETMLKTPTTCALQEKAIACPKMTLRVRLSLTRAKNTIASLKTRKANCILEEKVYRKWISKSILEKKEMAFCCILIDKEDELAKQFNKEEIEKITPLIIIDVSSCRVTDIDKIETGTMHPAASATKNQRKQATVTPARTMEYNFKDTVSDATAIAHFTFFTKAGEKITGHSCSELAAKYKGIDQRQLPIEVVNIIGKKQIFQIQFTSFIRQGSGQFTVIDILDIQPPIETKNIGTTLDASTFETTEESTGKGKNIP
nr:helitron helicase-like domain-containing protein [Tanacetum cinerariifolium]